MQIIQDLDSCSQKIDTHTKRHIRYNFHRWLQNHNSPITHASSQCAFSSARRRVIRQIPASSLALCVARFQITHTHTGRDIKPRFTFFLSTSRATDYRSANGAYGTERTLSSKRNSKWRAINASKRVRNLTRGRERSFSSISRRASATIPSYLRTCLCGGAARQIPLGILFIPVTHDLPRAKAIQALPHNRSDCGLVSSDLSYRLRDFIALVVNAILCESGPSLEIGRKNKY